MLAAVGRVVVQGQGGQGHGDVDQQQTGQPVFLVDGCVVCRCFTEALKPGLVQ